MDLNEIETKTDELLEKLASTTSAGEVRDLCLRLDGYAHAAQIKATVAHQARLAAQVPMQIGPGSIIPYVAPQPFPVCIAIDKTGREKCVLPAGHRTRHESGGVAPLSWPNDDPYPEPTKPVVDRLRELVGFIRGGQVGAPFASAEEVLGIVDELEEILKEGGL